MSTSITRLLHTFLLAALMLPLFTFAQVSPVGQELPAFLKDIKTEADFDKLTPAQKAEAEEYMKNLSDNFVMVADVSIYDAKITSENNGVIGLSFDLANGEGVQTGVKYSVSLIRKTDAGEFLADIYVYPEVLTLKSQSTLKKEITYTAPSGLSGEYTVLIKSSTESGLLLGLSSPGTIVLAPALKGVEILTDTCDLHVEGEAGNPSYTLVQGVDITASEKLLLTCDVKNFGPIPVTVTPVYETRVQTMYGKVAPHEGGSMEALTLAGDETKSVTLTLPKVATPQAFDVRVALENTDTTSNAVIAHYVLVGSSATIRNVILDKESYSAGDTAKVSFIWTPAADGFPDSRHGAISPSATTLAVTIQDGTTPCITPQTVTLSGEVRQELSLPITASCAHPEFGFTITDASGTTLDSATLTTTEKPAPTMLEEGGNGGVSNTAKLIIILTTLSALVLLLALVKIHAKLHPNTVLKSLVFAVLIAGSLMGGAGKVEAVTWRSPQAGGPSFVANLNKASYTPGENIVISTTQQDNNCSNAGGIYSLGARQSPELLNPMTAVNFWQLEMNRSPWTTIVDGQFVAGGNSHFSVGIINASGALGQHAVGLMGMTGGWQFPASLFDIFMGPFDVRNAFFPAFINYSVVPACALTSGQACNPRNACGAVANGTVQCNGSCNVAAPALPVNQGQSCPSAANVCGMVSNAGTWNCGVCSSIKPADALCPTATIVAPDCAITQGNSTCNTTVSWNSANLGAPSVRQDGIQFSTDVSSLGVLKQLSRGAHTFTIFDGAVQKATVATNATCELGTRWNGATCEPPTITFEVCDSAGLNCAVSKDAIINTPLVLKWTSNGTKCDAVAGTGFVTGGQVNSSDAIVAGAVPGNETFTIVCTYDNVPKVQKSVTVIAKLPAPDLSATPRTVPKTPSNATLTWDIHGQLGCTLTGGSGLNSGGLALDPYRVGFTDTVTILGRTTYTLSCPGGTKTVTIDVAPKGYET